MERFRPLAVIMWFGLGLALSTGGAIADVFREPMTFQRATSGGNCASCVWIAAQGVVERDTATKFSAFLTSVGLADSPGINVHLHSPGGDLIGGVLLGIAIRDHRANTVVAASPVESTYDSGTIVVPFDHGISSQCSSACVFAFLGGVTRYASQTSNPSSVGFQPIGKLGVHQFYSNESLQNIDVPTFTADDRIRDQKVIAGLVSYLDLVDVSAELNASKNWIEGRRLAQRGPESAFRRHDGQATTGSSGA